MKVEGAEITPRAVMSKIFAGKFASKGPDVCNMRLEAHESVRAYGVRGLLGGRLMGHVATFTLSRPLRSQNRHECDDEDKLLSLLRLFCKCWRPARSLSAAASFKNAMSPPTCFWMKWKNAGFGFSMRWSSLVVSLQPSVATVVPLLRFCFMINVRATGTGNWKAS